MTIGHTLSVRSFSWLITDTSHTYTSLHAGLAPSEVTQSQVSVGIWEALLYSLRSPAVVIAQWGRLAHVAGQRTRETGDHIPKWNGNDQFIL